MKNKILALLTAVALGVAFVAAPVAATQPDQNGEHKVGICHRTNSDTNPYVYIEVDVEAAEPGEGLSDHISIFENDKGHKRVYWKSYGVWRGVPYTPNDWRDDYLADDPSHCEDFESEASPSVTPTPTSTSSPSPTPTVTTTPSPTVTPSGTPTPSVQPSPSVVPTPTPSIGVTPTPETPSPSLSPTPSVDVPGVTLPPTDTSPEVNKLAEVATAAIIGYFLVGGIAFIVFLLLAVYLYRRS